MNKNQLHINCTCVKVNKDRVLGAVLETREWNRKINEPPGWRSKGNPTLQDILCCHVVWTVRRQEAANTGEQYCAHIRHQGQVSANSNFFSAGKPATTRVPKRGDLLYTMLCFLTKQTELVFCHYIAPNHFENIVIKLTILLLSISFIVGYTLSVHCLYYGLESTKIMCFIDDMANCISSASRSIIHLCSTIYDL